LLQELAPELQIWECDGTVYRAGWLRDGIVCAALPDTAKVQIQAAYERLGLLDDRPGAVLQTTLPIGVQ
jgi:4-hydroxy-tetrahydrodipicolinate synthase